MNLSLSKNLFRSVREMRRATRSKYPVLQASTSGCNLARGRLVGLMIGSPVCRSKGGRLFCNP